jgi:hypothetical protein
MNLLFGVSAVQAPEWTSLRALLTLSRLPSFGAGSPWSG